MGNVPVCIVEWRGGRGRCFKLGRGESQREREDGEKYAMGRECGAWEVEEDGGGGAGGGQF